MSEQQCLSVEGVDLVIDFTDYDPPTCVSKSSLTLLAVWHWGEDIITIVDADEIERQLLKHLDAQTSDLREAAEAANHEYRRAA
jgi:hypothetical protein